MTTPSTSAAAPPQRYVALDGLRGLAALLVMLYHVGWANHLTGFALIRGAPPALDFFFVLSGFIIAASYGDRLRDRREAGHFLTTRFFRVYPVHIAVLAALVALEVLKAALDALGVAATSQPAFSYPNDLPNLATSLLLLQSLDLTGRLGWNFPSWSVSAEMGAYFLFAGLAALGLTRRSRPVVAAAGLGAALAYPLVLRATGNLDATDLYGLLRACAGFGLGVAVHRVSRDGWRPERLKPATATLAEAVLFGAVLVGLSYARGWGEIVLIPGFVALIWLFQADAGLVSRLLASRPVQFLGRTSYSFYLVHVPVSIAYWLVLLRVFGIGTVARPNGTAVPDVVPLFGDVALAGYVALTLGTAALVHHLIEEPGRLYGKRLVTRWRAEGRAVPSSRSDTDGLAPAPRG